MRPKQPSARVPIGQKADQEPSPTTSIAQVLRSKLFLPLSEHLLYDSYSAGELKDFIIRSGYAYRVRDPGQFDTLMNEYAFYAAESYVQWALSSFMESNKCLSLNRLPLSLPEGYSMSIEGSGCTRVWFCGEDGRRRIMRISLYGFNDEHLLLFQIKGINHGGKGNGGLMKKIWLIERLYGEKPFVCTIRPALDPRQVGIYDTGDPGHLSILIPGLDTFHEVASMLYEHDKRFAEEAKANAEVRKFAEKKLALRSGEIGRKLFVPLFEYLMTCRIDADEIEREFWRQIPVNLLSRSRTLSESAIRGGVTEAFFRLSISRFAQMNGQCFRLCSMDEQSFDDGRVMREYGTAAYTILDPKGPKQREVTEIDVLGEFITESLPVIFELKTNSCNHPDKAEKLNLRKRYIREIFLKEPSLCLITFARKSYVGRGETFDWVIKIQRRQELDDICRRILRGASSRNP